MSNDNLAINRYTTFEVWLTLNSNNHEKNLYRDLTKDPSVQLWQVAARKVLAMSRIHVHKHMVTSRTWEKHKHKGGTGNWIDWFSVNYENNCAHAKQAVNVNVDTT